MATKKAIHDPKAFDLRNLFNRGIELTNFSKIFFISGRTALDVNLNIHFPKDGVKQINYIVDRLSIYIKEAGYTLNEIVSFALTLTKDVNLNEQDEILNALTTWFKPIEVKPAGGTLRVIERLAHPDLVVELELILAR